MKLYRLYTLRRDKRTSFIVTNNDPRFGLVVRREYDELGRKMNSDYIVVIGNEHHYPGQQIRVDPNRKKKRI